MKAPELEEIYLSHVKDGDPLASRDLIQRAPTTALRLKQLALFNTINAHEAFVELLFELQALDALIIYEVDVAGYPHTDHIRFCVLCAGKGKTIVPTPFRSITNVRRLSASVQT